MRPSIGIAITTYNRREQLLRLVHSLRQHCRDQVHLAVFDDGSSDGTAAAVAPLVDAVLEAPNAGIPTNKNRALFYFLALQPVDQLILLEDDVVVTSPRWLRIWSEQFIDTATSTSVPPAGRATTLHFMASCWGVRVRLESLNAGALSLVPAVVATRPCCAVMWAM